MDRSIVSAFAAGALAGALVWSPALAAPTPSPAPAASASATANVKITNFADDPQTLTVAAGTEVIFTNGDDITHDVTSTDRGADGNPLFASGDIGGHQAWTHVFATPGTYAYVCSYHPYMKGTIIVK